MINTPTGCGARADGYEIRSAAVRHGHPLHHDDDRRLGRGPGDLRRSARAGAELRSLQELHARRRRRAARPTPSASDGASTGAA